MEKLVTFETETSAQEHARIYYIAHPDEFSNALEHHRQCAREAYLSADPVGSKKWHESIVEMLEVCE